MFTPDASRAARGIVLVELMVGLALGLLVVLTALVASTATLAAAGGGRDAADLQQRADAALHAIGRQVRQAGSVQMEGTADASRFSEAFEGWQASGMAVSGVEGGPGKPDVLRLSYEPAPDDEDEDCLGNGPFHQDKLHPDQYERHIDSEFLISADSTDARRLALYCEGTDPSSGKQSLVAGVDDLQLLFGVDDAGGHLQWVAGDAVMPDTVVRAVSVCVQVSGELQQGWKDAVDCQGDAISAKKTTGRAVRIARGIFRPRNAPG